MQIVMHLDEVMRERKYSVRALAKATGISEVNLTRIKNGRLKGIRFSSLKALCEVLECTPGDLIGCMSDEQFENEFGYLPEEEES